MMSIARARKNHGGWRNLFAKVLNVYRRDGAIGIRRNVTFTRLLSLATSVAGSREVGRAHYAEWISRYDSLTQEARVILRTRAERFANRPLVSIVMPTYNPKIQWLLEAIESVRNQIYPFWELCIADDASTDPAVRAVLLEIASKDSRIRIVLRKENGHISAASNSALKICKGEWIALLDHDDLLSEHALFWVVAAINLHPDIQLIYSDEDKIDEAGCRFDPYFKCEWNEDLFYSHNLISHLGVYRADLLREIDGFRIGMEGSQDYDLALRAIERIGPEQIHHVPRVLYHWRVHAESTAQSAEAKPYAMIAGERALNEHFQRTGVNGRVEFVGFGYRAHYEMPDPAPLVSLIVPTKNSLKLIKKCINSILAKTTYPRYEIIVVANGSDAQRVIEYFERISDAKVRVVCDTTPVNCSALYNAAVKGARGDIIGLLNNELEVISPDWLSEMVSNAIRPEVGAVGARLLFPDGTLQHAGVILGLGVHRIAGHAHYRMPATQHGYFGRASLIHSLSVVSAACMVIRKSVYEEVGGLSERDLSGAFNGVDFCLRVREAGHRNVWTPYAELYSLESASRSAGKSSERAARIAQEVAYMRERWGPALLNDPAYSPNLTLDHSDFSLAWPPRPSAGA